MDQLGTKLRQITGELKDYLETRFELFVLNVSEKITLWIGEAFQQIIGFSILGVGLLLGLFALSFYAGDLLNNTALGFAGVGGGVTLIGLIILLVKPKGIARRIQTQFMNDVLEALEEKPADEPKLLKQVEPEKEKKDGQY